MSDEVLTEIADGFIYNGLDLEDAVERLSKEFRRVWPTAYAAYMKQAEEDHGLLVEGLEHLAKAQQEGGKHE